MATTEHSAGGARDRTRLLSDVASALSAAGSVEAVMRALASAFVPDVCDGFEVALGEADGTIRRITVGLEHSRSWALREVHPVPEVDDHPVRVAMRTGRPQLLDLSLPEHVRLFGSPEDPASARSLGVRLAVVAPMTGREKPSGAVGAGLGPSGRSWSDGDVEFIASVARLAGLALENLEALERQHRTVAMLERAALVGTAMASLAGEESVAESAVSLAREQLGASSGFVYVLAPDGTLSLAAKAGHEHTGVRSAIELDAEIPVAEAVRTGRLVALDSKEAICRRYPGVDYDDGYLEQALLAAPMLADDAPIGAVYWGFDEPRPLGEGECRFAEVIAEQCAAGIVRARAEAARRQATEELTASRERLAALAGAGLIGILSGTGRSIEEANDAFLAMLGLTAADLEGGIDLARLSPERTAGLREVVGEELRANGRIGPYETELVHADGREVPVMFGAAVLPGGGGRWTAFVTDVTALRSAELRAEEALATAEKARHTVELMLDEQRRIASMLQSSLIPARLPEIPGVEVAAYHWPGGSAARVGGDFYDVLPLGQDRFGLLIGDVCGKGVRAAVVTAAARHTARAAALHLDEPVEVLSWVHDAVAAQADDCFCTMAYGVLELSGDGARLSFALGGHPPPLLVTAGDARPVGQSGTLLGLFSPTLYRSDVEVPRGALLVFYTDGITDAPGAQAITEEELAAIVLEYRQRNLHELASIIRRELDERRRGREHDDTALLLVRLSQS